MNIKIICVGEKMPHWVNEAYNEYNKRLSSSNIKMQLIELPISPRTKNTNINVWLKNEATNIEQKLNPHDHIIVFDVQAKLITTEDFASKVNYWQENKPSVAIIIGGPDGIADSIKQKSHEKISLSKMTLPHPLARIMIIEQIYRAWTVLQNHPYHK